jgi:hypothetical protein
MTTGAMQPAFGDAPTNRLYAPDPVTAAFNREDDPPTETPLRLLVEDAWREYSIPWPYVFRSHIEDDGDFFAVKTGYALHDSISVRGWMLWSEEAAHG